MTRRRVWLVPLLALAACDRAPEAPAPVRLQTVKVELPTDPAYFEGPHAELLNGNCTACHSAEMALTQPDLTTEQWAATVRKMREVYKAPIAEGDVPRIAAALAGLRRE